MRALYAFLFKEIMRYPLTNLLQLLHFLPPIFFTTGEKYVIFSIHKPSLSANPVMDYFLLTFLIPYPHTPKRLFNSYAPFDYFWDSFAANEDDFQKLMERRAKSYEGVKKVD